jgi:hypothetical protein
MFWLGWPVLQKYHQIGQTPGTEYILFCPNPSQGSQSKTFFGLARAWHVGMVEKSRFLFVGKHQKIQTRPFLHFPPQKRKASEFGTV